MPVSIKDEFREWLRENMLLTNRFWDLPWNSIFPYMCHEIWKDRNECVFKKQNPSPFRLIGFRAGKKVLDHVATVSTSVILDPLVLAHPREVLMMHVDASFVGSREAAGLGG